MAARSARAASTNSATTATAPTAQASLRRRLRGGAGGRRHVPVAVVLLHELAEAEVGVLGPRRDAAAPRAGGLEAAAQHELDLRGEEDDERQPERHDLAEPLDEQPRDDEADRGDAEDELCSVPVDHATTVVAA